MEGEEVLLISSSYSHNLDKPSVLPRDCQYKLIYFNISGFADFSLNYGW